MTILLIEGNSMFENYSNKEFVCKKLDITLQRKLTKELHNVEIQIFDKLFDFSIDLDDDIHECIRLIDASNLDLVSTVKRVIPEDIFTVSTDFDEHRTKINSFSTFRKTGERLRIDFDYYRPEYRFEFRVVVFLSDDNEMITYEEYGAKSDNNVIAVFIKNSLIILNKVDSIISKYHDS